MFLTITIDTKKSKIKMNKSKVQPKMWRKSLNMKKRSLWQRLKKWRRTIKQGYYKLGDQPAMF